MNLIRYLLLTSGWLLAACTGATLAQSGAPSTAAKPVVTLQMPALPESVPVTVTAATTALLVFDMVDPICTTQPKCMATMVPPLLRSWQRREAPACSCCMPRADQRFQSGLRKLLRPLATL